jgi:hypothetical protein
VELDPDGWLLHAMAEKAKKGNRATGPGLIQPEAPEPVQLLPAAPNPFNPLCLIRWRARQASQDVLVIYDLQGRRILSSSWPWQSPGTRRFTWDGRDDHGRECAAGVYLFAIDCRLRSGELGPNGSSRRLTGKMTLAR